VWIHYHKQTKKKKTDLLKNPTSTERHILHTLVCKLRKRQTCSVVCAHSHCVSHCVLKRLVVCYRDVGATGVGCSVWFTSETRCLEVMALCQQFLEAGCVRR